MNKKTDRVTELDLMRFVAALAVVIYHWIGPEWGLGAYHITQLGYLGVELFFLISGFVILWTATGKTGYEFVASRLARLYPSFWICLFLAIALTGWDSYTPQQILANVTMIPDPLRQTPVDQVYWTLFVEMKFYAMVFFLIIARQMKHIERWLAGWLVLTVAAMIPAASGALNFVTLGGFSAFFAGGCYLYLVRSGGLTLSRGIGLLASLAAGIHHVVTHVDGNVRQPMAHVEFALAGVVTAQYLIFLLVALRVVRLPKFKTLTVLGAMTYPLYLVHYRIGGMFRDDWLAGWGRVPQMVAALVFCLALALLLAMTVERHGCPAVQRWLLAINRRWQIRAAPQVTR